MRGALILLIGEIISTRITPAHAGSTIDYALHIFSYWDHPCSCGEHLCYMFQQDHKLGSPLLMRGARVFTFKNYTLSRITPVHAGSTESGTGIAVGKRDHPCSCGEHILMQQLKKGRLGSPLLMRGALKYSF